METKVKKQKPFTGYDQYTNTYRYVVKACKDAEVPKFKSVKEFSKFVRAKLKMQESTNDN